MNELIIDKTFETREELEAYEDALNDTYVIFMIMRKEQVLGEQEVYGIDKIIYVRER